MGYIQYMRASKPVSPDQKRVSNPRRGRGTHIPHSNSSYHSSLGTILSISSNVRITLAPELLIDAVFLTVDVGSSCENRTRGDVGDVGDIALSARVSLGCTQHGPAPPI